MHLPWSFDGQGYSQSPCAHARAHTHTHTHTPLLQVLYYVEKAATVVASGIMHLPRSLTVKAAGIARKMRSPALMRGSYGECFGR